MFGGSETHAIDSSAKSIASCEMRQHLLFVVQKLQFLISTIVTTRIKNAIEKM
jgi:hypothetical protein